MSAGACRTLTLLCAVLAACGRGRDAPPEQAVPDTTTSPAEAPLSDNQALDVLLALSNAGARAADSVPASVWTSEVRRYLGVVRTDHQALQAELQAITDSLQLAPEPHAAAERLSSAAQDSRMALSQQVEGSSDLAALQQQVKLHTMFLGTLDSAVLRGARQELLARYAKAVRPLVAAHLQRAEQLARLLRDRPPVPRAAARPAAPVIDTPPRPRPAALELGRRQPPDTVPLSR